MQTPEELFNKAKNIKPPLSDSEAEKIIIEAKPIGNISKPLLSKTSITIVATLAVISLVVFWQYNSTSPQNTTLNSTDTSKNYVDADTAITARELTQPKKEHNLKSTHSSTKISKSNPYPITKKQPTKKQLQQDYTQKTVVNNKPPHPINDEDIGRQELEKGFVNTGDEKKLHDRLPQQVSSDTIKTRVTYNTDDSVKLTNIDADTTLTTNRDSLEAIAKLLRDSLESITKLLKDKIEPPENGDSSKIPFKRWHLKTDLLGYMYNNVLQKTMFKTDVFSDGYDVTGNRVSFGVEYRFSKRLSVGLMLGYGFTNNMFRGSYGYGSNSYYNNFEIVTNYKGLMISFEPRYYYLAKKHSNLFIAPYLGYARLSYRRFFAGQSPPATHYNFYTLGTTKGTSLGLGLATGYKFKYKKFFIEPLMGIVFVGRDNEYEPLERTEVEPSAGFEPRHWLNLWRLELFLGIEL